ncbi:uncharacterized protein LOC127987090 [Carassius gibelio]|uniref:uncharacterized protein LOC127987090 n=1 Tax=Carassius gibelio TaxID=101364 RepID=UPI0022791F0B|nr:uncharacterized protein LOC127987090 [Carassius gibelio]
MKGKVVKMKPLFNWLAVILFLHHYGVSGADTDRVSVSVKEGDLVTLHTGVEPGKLNYIAWYFNDTQINGNLSHNHTDVQCNKGTERFGDRLKLDNRTGSLTIMDIRITDAGVYKLQIINSSSSKKFSVDVSGLSATERYQIRHVMNGESITLVSGEAKDKCYLMTWYYNDNLITEMTGDQSKICTDDQCKERFRNRLKLNQTTGSLTITNMNITDSGVYQLQIIISNSSLCIARVKRFTVTVFFPAVGICVLVVLLLMSATVTAGVIYCRQKKYKPQILNMRMMLSRHRIRKTLLKGLGMTLNQTQDEAGYKLV